MAAPDGVEARGGGGGKGSYRKSRVGEMEVSGEKEIGCRDLNFAA